MTDESGVEIKGTDYINMETKEEILSIFAIIFNRVRCCFGPH